MIDNFDIIRSLMKFENENDFYFLQIIQRKKEHSELGRNNRCVKTFYVHSEQKFNNYEEEIKQLCKLYNARAYIHLNRRNQQDLAFELLEDIVHSLKSKQFQGLYRSYDSACGRHHSKKDKTWVVDIDDNNGYHVVGVSKVIDNLQPFGIKVLKAIPTKNGVHLITKPFNSMEFKKIFPEIEVHKNNPTCLFIP